MISKQQRTSGMVFMGLGAYVIYYTLANLKVGTVSAPGSGFFTIICGATILLLASILVISGFVKGAESVPLWEEGQWKKPLYAYIIAVAYALMMKPLGFIIATAVFLIAWQIVVEREKPVKIAILAASGSIGMWIIFEKLLRVALPNGVLPW